MFAEDLAPFFADFGEDASLAGVSVRVIFDAPGGSSLGVGIEQPQVQIRTADVPAAYKDAEIVLPARGTFRVREHTPDGTGMSLLTLREVP